jgi:hypothetical protein
MSWAWECGPADPIDRYVLLKLADNADQDGRCFPSRPEICDKTRLSVSTVKRSIGNLEREGWITVKRGDGRGHRSQYQINKRGSEGTGSQRTGSERTGSVRPKKGFTENEKGFTEKNPPDPLIGRTIKNHHEPSQKPTTTFVLPDSISQQLWDDYEEMRRTIKKPMTSKARTLIVAKLLKLGQSGHDPATVLEQSIENSWAGVFEIKSFSNGQGVKNANGNRSQQRSHGNISALESIARENGMDLGAADSSRRSASGVHQRADNEDLFRAAV